LELTHEFDLPAPVSTCWDLLLDLERVAPCLPGAEISRRVDDRTYEVMTNVNLGPMRMRYNGELVIAEIDPAGRRTVMRANAKDVRGQGTASATIVTTLAARGDATHASAVTELQLTGRVAQVGRGIVADVSDQLMAQFASSLSALAAGAAPASIERRRVGALRLLLGVVRARLARLRGRGR
jgi:carbon monoxide dehydrogenase subunit G